MRIVRINGVYNDSTITTTLDITFSNIDLVIKHNHLVLVILYSDNIGKG